MQLKRLEAYGFKSFADKIEIEFDHGITAIVGPNGSGKSNISDAIRWVLGEQNIRNLRGTKAADIIFSGSAQRKALGVAEVSLVFENQGDMAIDFKEVVVTRRLYRSGESEFFLNRAPCRLKDIYNLFADTGIGHDGMSIIGQNRIDDVLNSKPEEKRAFFEETAGITKYRNRKKETMRKLDDTENNLVRLSDIKQEIETQLEPLSRQAEKTRQYNELNTSFQRVRLTNLHQKHEKLTASMEENGRKKQEFSDRVTEIQTEIQTMEAKSEGISKAVIDIEQEIKAQADQNEQVRGQLEEVNNRLAILRDRENRGDTDRERILNQRSELETVIQSVKQQMEELETKEQFQNSDLKLMEELLEKDRKKAGEIRKRIDEQDKLRLSCEEKLKNVRTELAEKQKELALVRHDLDALEEGKSQRESIHAAAKAELEELRREQEDLRQETDDLGKKLQELSDNEQEERRLKKEMSEEYRRLQESERIKQQEAQKLESRMQILERMQQAYEGFGKAPKAVLKSQEPWHKGICGAVAELLQVSQKYVTAVEVALGGNLQNIVAEDEATVKAAISFLKRERLGRVTFLPLSSLVIRKQESGNVKGEPGVIGYANTLVGSDEKYRRAVDFLLSRTLVVDTLDNGLALAKKQGYRMRIVTLEGELLTPGGAISGGSHQHREASFLNRTSEIESARSKLSENSEQLKRLSEKRGETEKNLVAVGSRLDEIEEEIQKTRVHKAELRVSLEGIAHSLSEKEQAYADIKQREQEQQTSFAQLDRRRVMLAREEEELLRKVDAAEQKALDETAMLDDFEQDAEELAEYIQQRHVKHAVLEQQVFQSRQNILLSKKDLDRSQARLEQNLKEEKELEESLKQAAEKMEELRKKTEAFQTDFDAGQAVQDKLFKDKMQKLEEKSDLDQKVKEAGRKLKTAEHQLSEAERVLDRDGYSLQECETKMLEDFGLTPERAAEEAEDLPVEEINSRLAELSDKMKALGAVNPNAVQEYEELKTRHDFMEKQSEDLVEAKENLLVILKEMDEKMTEQFKEAFAQIQIYFGEIFVRLFEGGKAELELLDPNDVLNTGVDIIVQLPQKKRQNMSALSGGERALTVIALLFAFLKYRPSPFSVLDEIDAPLDEANVVRFGSFLREFSAQTQFIVVTHRKSTMESVDRMYGVTIEDAGVSRILSVKLDNIA